MNYKQLDQNKKAQIDILLENKYSTREIGRILNISHSTVSRYKNGIYQKRHINIHEKYKDFLDYLYLTYDRKVCSIEICVHNFNKYYPYKPSVSCQQVYNWINEGKINITVKEMCYKRHKNKKKKITMMNHFAWNMENKTVLPISLRPKYIENRDELGHLEIDSIVGKRNEYGSIISIVDRCSRVLWLIKAEAKNEYYIMNLIHKYIKDNDIIVRSITTDNGLEFKALGVAAKRLDVKLYKCDPYCSFQRGTNERYNVLVRRFIPKGESMNEFYFIIIKDLLTKCVNKSLILYIANENTLKVTKLHFKVYLLFFNIITK